MNLLHLRYFYEVARTRGFTAAAKNLRVSQPAISKMVRLLERDLDRKLLDRSRKRLLLTPAGEQVFESAARIFAEARRMEEGLRSGARELSGQWSIGASDNIGIHLLPKPLRAFKDRHPKLRISAFFGTATQIKEELREERCALGIFYTPLKASEPFEGRKILETEFWVVIARKNRWIPKRSIRLSELRSGAVPRIESRHADYSSGFPAHFHSVRLGFKDPPWLEVNQHEVKKRLVMEGAGFAILTRPSVEAEVRSGKLVRVQGVERLAAPIFAVWKKGRSLDPASTEFLKAFVPGFGV